LALVVKITHPDVGLNGAPWGAPWARRAGSGAVGTLGAGQARDDPSFDPGAARAKDRPVGRRREADADKKSADGITAGARVWLIALVGRRGRCVVPRPAGRDIKQGPTLAAPTKRRAANVR